MSAIEEFNNKVIDKFVDSITDRVFLMIQEDRYLMLEYLRLVSNESLDSVNMSLGKAVKNRLNLGNAEEEEKPQSSLIKSYTKHVI
ncbi:MAG: hypothetical protein P9X24_15560 [Candidatus Hatepunaea meridiana]|nr:hypothetical protein [Candidatus Hatepunaea meridiana]